MGKNALCVCERKEGGSINNSPRISMGNYWHHQSGEERREEETNSNHKKKLGHDVQTRD